MTMVAQAVGFFALACLTVSALAMLLVLLAAVRDHVSRVPATDRSQLLDLPIRDTSRDEAAWSKLAELIVLEDERRARANIVDLSAERAVRRFDRGGAA